MVLRLCGHFTLKDSFVSKIALKNAGFQNWQWASYGTNTHVDASGQGCWDLEGLAGAQEKYDYFIWQPTPKTLMAQEGVVYVGS